MKTKFREFLNEASINANGDLEDFTFNPFDEEFEDLGGDEEFDADQNKNNLIVYVTNVENNPDFNELDSSVCISFYRLDGSMVDNDMLGLFPEIGGYQEYDNGGEGFLMYYGDMTIPEIRTHLRRLGFNVSDEEDDFGSAARNINFGE